LQESVAINESFEVPGSPSPPKSPEMMQDMGMTNGFGEPVQNGDDEPNMFEVTQVSPLMNEFDFRLTSIYSFPPVYVHPRIRRGRFHPEMVSKPNFFSL
jgi:hypothetical protein